MFNLYMHLVNVACNLVLQSSSSSNSLLFGIYVQAAMTHKTTKKKHNDCNAKGHRKTRRLSNVEVLLIRTYMLDISHFIASHFRHLRAIIMSRTVQQII